MILLGTVWKDGKDWLAGVKLLDVFSQGKTQKEAIAMLADAIHELILAEYKRDVAIAAHLAKGTLSVSIAEAVATGLLLKRFRQSIGLSQDEVARKLNVQKNAYAQYEQCRRIPTTSQLQKMIAAIDEESQLALSLADGA